MATTQRRKRTGTPEAYDFRQPMTLVREHARVLEMSFETFSRQLGTQLTSRLRVVSQATLSSVEMTSYDDYVRSLPVMTTFVVCGVEPGRSQAILQLPLDASMLWIDHMLGGPGLPVPNPDRELTEIEWELLRDLLHYALRDLRYAFSTVLPLDVTVRTVQYNPQFAQVVSATDVVIVATFQVTVGEHTFPATFMIQAELLLAALRDGDAPDRRTVDEVRAHEMAVGLLTAQVHEVPVPVSVRFDERQARAADLDALEVGDVLPLFHRSDAPLGVVVGDVVVARAAIGSHGTRLAALVVASEENHS